ncbi:hypothetical protein ASZ90_009397 [hydrocarbon metagenome]|uniref:Uncharacterized protein n=1 Tax=hydrocarbon metagenome TaxID=938273 RepID=A0A0W8FIZ9_9ZZZZ
MHGRGRVFPSPKNRDDQLPAGCFAGSTLYQTAIATGGIASGMISPTQMGCPLHDHYRRIPHDPAIKQGKEM